MPDHETVSNPVDLFMARQFPAALTAFIDYLDALRDAGQVTTLDELRAELVNLAAACRMDEPKRMASCPF